MSTLQQSLANIERQQAIANALIIDLRIAVISGNVVRRDNLLSDLQQANDEQNKSIQAAFREIDGSTPSRALVAWMGVV